LVLGAEVTEMAKLVPAVLALMNGATKVVLQVTPSFDPNDESKVTRIWLFAVTAVVSTVMLVVLVGMLRFNTNRRTAASNYAPCMERLVATAFY
jgi:hypothetical protein